MNSTLFISIIIPVYNSESFLMKMLDSVLVQTFTNFEIILIDDGSVDKSPQICDDYAIKDKRIKVVHTVNKGVSSARNVGIEIAQGDYLIFFDSDDWVDNTVLEEYVNAITKYDADIVFQGIVMEFFNKSVSFDIKEKVYFKDDICNAVMYLTAMNTFGWMCNKIYRKNIIMLHKIRFQEDLSIQEDCLFTLNYLAYANTLSTLPYASYHYRNHNESLANKRNSYHTLKRKSELIYSEMKRLFGGNSNFPEIIYINSVLRSFVRMYEKPIKLSFQNRVYEYKCFTNFVRQTDFSDVKFKHKLKFLCLKHLPSILFEPLIYSIFNIRRVLKKIRK